MVAVSKFKYVQSHSLYLVASFSLVQLNVLYRSEDILFKVDP